MALSTLAALLLFSVTTRAQRVYKPASVLASGNWYKISVSTEGVYKLDGSFLASLGISGPIPSAQIRLFGNGGGMLPEANSQARADDLEENAVMVVDGGDGLLNGSDYVLFFAPGPDHWIRDSVNRRFSHQKNLYGDKAYYYLTIGGTGKRIPVQGTVTPASLTVTSFDERYFHESDTVNFLSSGKEWYGEEFSSAPGKTLSRSFVLPLTDVLPGPATVVSNVAARSVNQSSSFSLAVNGQPVQQIPLPGVGTGTYDLFAQSAQRADPFFCPDHPVVTLSYTPGSFNSQGWLNWFELFCRRKLALPSSGQLLFRDWNSVNPGGAAFVLSQADPDTQVWDVTDPLDPVKMNATLSADQLQFTGDARTLHEYVGFAKHFLNPVAEGKIENQNLHAGPEADFLLVSYGPFLQQARRLAAFHQQHEGLRTVVVTADQVFNEFSGGLPDPSAIRDFAKMYYDRYRAGWNEKKYLLLLGKASFDYKNRVAVSTNLVPGYESGSSLDPLSTYTSDDFFGFLNDQDDINAATAPQLELGIGRIPARNVEEARNFVDKVLDYHAPASLGPWRNNLDLIADDEDLNLHLQDAENLSATVASVAPYLNQEKVYLDAFHQESSSSGGRYPQANTLINNNIYNGTLIWNFSGHGGPQRLAEEVVIDPSIVDTWSNASRLPLFITATCDFAPFDNPLVPSLGENLLLRPKTGAIGLMTTTRVVFASSNRIINTNYLKFALQPDSLHHYRTLGAATLAAKNYTYRISGDVVNNRKFSLLGDPAMTIGFPQFLIKLNKINGTDLGSGGGDTLRATETVVMEGEVDDPSGVFQPDFKGIAYLTLFDKPRTVTTLGNDPTSSPVGFQDQSSILFRGKASVENGHFKLQFKMPKDMNYQYGNGKISLYAQNGSAGGSGFSNEVVTGGMAQTLLTDHQGPEIKAYLNDEKFVNGSITNSTPVLVLRLSDSSGMNTVGSGIGHDMTATLDHDNNRYFVLNNFYESDLDNYQKGSVHFQLPQLDPGPHSLKIKVWDVMNNSSEYNLDFVVVAQATLKIEHVLNYPNPFTTRTSFWFEHNQPGTDLDVKVEIFTIGGRLIKSLAQTINSPGNRSNEILWDGRDEFGNKTGRGVYIYRLRVRNPEGKLAEKWEKLVIL
ncbi:MAG: type IX secretion system sortase PorU [Flavisolibacter sp.]